MLIKYFNFVFQKCNKNMLAKFTCVSICCNISYIYVSWTILYPPSTMPTSIRSKCYFCFMQRILNLSYVLLHYLIFLSFFLSIDWELLLWNMPVTRLQSSIQFSVYCNKWLVVINFPIYKFFFSIENKA